MIDPEFESWLGQTEHASFIGGMNAKYEAQVIMCGVDDEKCHSAQEFRQLVRKKFGISFMRAK
jgi:hypothetical protein